MDDADATRWSRIEAGDREHLVRTYWAPVHRFLARRLPGPEEAEDATQDLFVAFFEREFLARADRSRGSFRTLLYHAARQFLIDRYRQRGAARRDAGRTVPLADDEAVGGPDPVAEFDRQWYLSLVNRIRRDVRDELVGRGKPEVYRAFHLCVFGDGTGHRPPQAEVATRLGLSIDRVKKAVGEARTLFARRARAIVRQTTATDDEVEAELACLVRSLADRMPGLVDSLA